MRPTHTRLSQNGHKIRHGPCTELPKGLMHTDLDAEPRLRRLRPSPDGKWFGRRVHGSPAHQLTGPRQGQDALRTALDQSTTRKGWGRCAALFSPIQENTARKSRGCPFSAGRMVAQQHGHEYMPDLPPQTSAEGRSRRPANKTDPRRQQTRTEERRPTDHGRRATTDDDGRPADVDPRRLTTKQPRPTSEVNRRRSTTDDAGQPSDRRRSTTTMTTDGRRRP